MEGGNHNSNLRIGKTRRNMGHCSHLDIRRNHNSRNHNLEIIPKAVVDIIISDKHGQNLFCFVSVSI